MNKRKLLAALLVGAMAITSVGCNLIEKTQKAIDREVVAKGKGIKITRGQLNNDENMKTIMEKFIALNGKNYKSDEDAVKQLAGYKRAIIQNMVEDKIIADKLKEYKIEVSEQEMTEEVNKRLEERKESLGGEEEFQKIIEESGTTVEKLKEQFEAQIRYDRLFDKVTESASVKDEDVKTYYDSNKGNFTEEPNTVNVSYMLVDTQEKADEIVAKLEKGESFETLAKENSLDESTKEKGGELGDITYSNSKLGSSIMTMIKALETGSVKTIEDSRGFNIIKVGEKKDYPIKEFDAVKEEIKEMLLNIERQRVWREESGKWFEEINLKIDEDKLV